MATLVLPTRNMENKEIWKREFGTREYDWSTSTSGVEIQSMTVEGEGVQLDFADGTKLIFATHHDQDCCEHVYGDFSVMKYHEKELVGKTLREVQVKRVEGMGFLLCFNSGWDENTKVFIACYNYQNGYYSSDLELTIDDNGTKITVDVSDCVEDHID